MLWSAIVLALGAIKRNLMRSLLTVLGIEIGVAAVIILVTIGNGTTAQVQKQIASMGSNLLMVSPGKRMGPGRSTATPFKAQAPKPLPLKFLQFLQLLQLHPKRLQRFMVMRIGQPQ